MIVTEGERLRDKIEEILPDREDFARSAEEIAIWAGCTADQAQRACRSLQRFKAVGMKLEWKRTAKKTNTSRSMWWRTG
jgi:hypothetical protein